MSRLLVWGAGGHGKVVLDVAMATGRYSDISFFDDGPPKAKEFCHCPLTGSFDGLTPEGSEVVIAIGSNEARARCFECAQRMGWQPATLIHPTAIVSPSARIGAGTVVMPRAVVNADAEIGENCIINTAAVVEHDCRIADHVHLSPGVVLGGAVTVGPFAHMGLGAIALPGSEINDWATVGAGAVVLRSVESGETVVGVPARGIDARNRRPALHVVGGTR
jgi:acetyltransferase EpsM